MYCVRMSDSKKKSPQEVEKHGFDVNVRCVGDRKVALEAGQFIQAVEYSSGYRVNPTGRDQLGGSILTQER